MKRYVMRNEIIYQKYFDKIIMVGRLCILYQIFRQNVMFFQIIDGEFLYSYRLHW